MFTEEVCMNRDDWVSIGKFDPPKRGGVSKDNLGVELAGSVLCGIHLAYDLKREQLRKEQV